MGNNDCQIVLIWVSSYTYTTDLNQEKMLTLVKRQRSGDTWRVVIAHQDPLEKYVWRQVIASGVDWFRWFDELVFNKISLSPEREIVQNILIISLFFTA